MADSFASLALPHLDWLAAIFCPFCGKKSLKLGLRVWMFTNHFYGNRVYLRDSATGQCFFQFKLPLTRMLLL